MQIQALTLLLTDADLKSLLEKNPPPGVVIDGLTARFTPEGVVVTGRYPTPFMAVPFETLWQLSVEGPCVRAKLANVRVMGLPGAMLTGMMMKMIRESVAGKPGVSVENDSVVAHAGEAFERYGLAVDVKFAVVRLSIGAAVIEASA